MNLKELNSNIPAKNRKIKSTYPSMKRVRVYFVIRVWTLDGTLITESKDLRAAQVDKAWLNTVNTPEERKTLLSMRPAKYHYTLTRVQTSGYVGGIVLSGSAELVEECTF